MDPSWQFNIISSFVSLFGMTQSTKVTIFALCLAILIIMSAFFSAAETAFSSASRLKLKTLESNGNKKAGRVLKQLEKYDRLISTLLIGNNVVNMSMATISALLFSTIIKNQSLAPTISTIIITIVVLIFCEITPKVMAKDHAERISMALEPAVRGVIVILMPVNAIFVIWKKLLGKIFKVKKEISATEDELITMVEEVTSEGGINEHESKLIRSAIEFEDVDVFDIMVPRVKVVAVAKGECMESISDKFYKSGFSRLPVYEDSIDTIVGIIHEKDFNAVYKRNETDISSIIKHVICMSENMKISAALRMLQKEKVHLAIVVDEFGGTSGIVTMEDILEELVGEIWDEHDEEEIFFKKLDDSTFVFSGSESMDDMLELLDIENDDEYESSTVGGWVTEILKKIPAPGETFTLGNYNIEVTEANEKSVLQIKATSTEAKNV